MLDIVDVREMISNSWESLASPVDLPEEWVDFFDRAGPTDSEFNDQRSYHRFHLRSKAILLRDDTCYGVFTKDISRTGMAFYCGEQIFPCERVALCLLNGKRSELSIARCLRIQQNCYECGATYVR